MKYWHLNGPERRRAAFTFVEVLAALLFLSLVVPTIVEGLTIANRASVMAERSALAGEFAQNKLGEMVIDSAWANAPATRGDFGAASPGYRWQMSTANWTGDTINPMTELVVDVYFTVQGQEYNVHLSTLVSPPATNATTTTGATPAGT